jgi:NAD(P)-dependent dehydrogenase (short-subunit alcohol dehydrogenase family)
LGGRPGGPHREKHHRQRSADKHAHDEAFYDRHACHERVDNDGTRLGSSHLPDYSATKGAINAFTKALARNLIEKGIRLTP